MRQTLCYEGAPQGILGELLKFLLFEAGLQLGIKEHPVLAFGGLGTRVAASLIYVLLFPFVHDFG